MPGCLACNALPPGWKAPPEDPADIHECLCGFEYYKTVAACPLCERPREGGLDITTKVQSYLEGVAIFDHTDKHWSRDLDNAHSITSVWWSEKLFVVPTYGEDENERRYEEAIAEGGGVAYCFHGERILQEGGRIFVYHDPQVFSGHEWAEFSAAKEILSPGDKPEW